MAPKKWWIGALLALPWTSYAVPDACDAFGSLDSGGPASGGDTVFIGGARNENVGAAVANIGDFNGDGHDDLAVGAPGDGANGTRAGAVYVWFGPIANEGALTKTAADLMLVGPGAAANAGSALAAGDLDGDGRSDLVIGGAPGSASPFTAGVAWVVYGSASPAPQRSLATADVTLTGVAAGDRFGTALAVGDVTGDGDLDLIVGAPTVAVPGVGTGAGAVFVFTTPRFGAVGALTAEVVYTGTMPGERAGTAVYAANALSGGAAELVVGAPQATSNAGRVYVVGVGSTAGVTSLSGADRTYEGSAGSRLGSSLGHLTGDVADTLVLGAKQFSAGKRGAVYLVSPDDDVTGVTPVADAWDAFIKGTDSNDLFGSSIAGNVDFDADGELDLVIGAERADGAALLSGAAYALHGPFAGEFTVGAVGRFHGDLEGAFTGAAVAAFDDLNGDGFADILIASPSATVAGRLAAGAAGLFLGGHDVTDAVAWYRDADGDTWGTSATSQIACTAPSGFVARAGDCNDASNLFRPFVVESSCGDPTDYNCDGSVGNVDLDGDGVQACQGDCADNLANVATGQPERCGDDLDNDCNQAVDDALAIDAFDFRPDADGDGYGSAAFAVRACEVPAIFLTPPVTVGGDCNDANAAIKPTATETCDTVDNDCDGATDEGDAADALVWFADDDGDGYGDVGSTTRACAAPVGFVSDARDCDDTSETVRPGAVEVCDYADNDCDGSRYLGGPVDVEVSDATLLGATNNSRFGSVLAWAPDMDADGVAELVVGAPNDSAVASDAGSVWVGPPVVAGTYDFGLTRPDGSGVWRARIRSDRARGGFGVAVAGGDFNGDGIGDVAVGAPDMNRGGLTGAGGVFVYHGPLQGSLTLADADVVIDGPSAGARFGTALAAGDVDGDGVDDLVIGVPRAAGGGTRRGAAYVLYGGVWTSGSINLAPAGQLQGAANDEELGAAVALTGDVTGDGLVDVAAGSPIGGAATGGVARVFAGTGARWSGAVAATVSWSHQTANRRAGLALAGVGDVDGDGTGDLVVGSGSNQAWLIAGGTADGFLDDAAVVRFDGDGAQRFGASVAAAGDVNGDGLADMLFGAPEADGAGTDAGQAVLIYGAATWPADVVDTSMVESFGRAPTNGFPTYSYVNAGGVHGAVLGGEATQHYAGRAVIGGQDLNGDGSPDLVVGADRAGGAGRAYVHFAGPYGLDVAAEVPGAGWDQHLGIDGDSADWTDDVRFPTGAGGTSAAAFTWDDEAVYLGSKLVDVRTGGPSHFFVAYLGDGDATGHDVGQVFNTQHPGLPFKADKVLIWRADDLFASLSTWNGSSWQTQTFASQGVTRQEFNVRETVEFRIPRAALGNPSTVEVVAYWLFEGAGFETSYAPFPASAFTAGYDRDPQDWYRFELGRPAAPAAYGWLPDGGGPPSLDGSMTQYWYDLDTDGHADETRPPFLACPMHAPISFERPATPELAALTAGAPVDDCDDLDAGINPDATDIANNGLDEDCDGSDSTGPNPPPTVTCVLDSTAPASTANITVTAGATDPDGGSVSFTYEWYRNGVLDPAVTGTTYPAASTAVGDVIEAVCYGNDGEGNIVPQVAAAATVPNQRPVVTTCGLSPTDPVYRTDTLIATTTATDADGEATTGAFEWYVNGGYDAGDTNDDYSLAGLTPGDVVEVVCYATDGHGLSSNSMVVARTVANHNPAFTAPPALVIDHTLAIVDATATDADGDPLTYTYVWRVNGAVVPGQSTDSLDGSFFDRGDLVACEVTVDDTFHLTTGTATAVGPNAPPTVASATVAQAVIREATTVTCTAGAINDPDGDPVSLTTTWLVNGVAAGSGPSLTGTAFNKGQTVQCRLTPNDGFDNGAAVTSAGVVVSNTAPTDPVVQIRPEVADSLDEIWVEVVTPATDPDPADTVDYLIFWDLDGTDWTDLADTTSFTDDTIPVENVLSGTFTVEVAAFDDDNETSNTVSDVHDVFEWYQRPRVRVGNNSSQSHACAILDNGDIKCWGANGNGQLGLGDTAARGDAAGEMGDALPAVDVPGTLDGEMIAVGFTHTCALLSDGRVYCWGTNSGTSLSALGRTDNTQVGDSASEMGDALVPVAGLTGQIAQLESGNFNTCVRKTDGEIWCWGANNVGELGQDSPGARASAVRVDLGTGRTAKWLGMGAQHACAVLDNNTIKCWGNNANGQLGLGDTTVRGSAPNLMGDNLPALSFPAGVTPIFVDGGAQHSCAMFSDASVRCWGGNSVGQLGRGDTTQIGDGPGEMGALLASVQLLHTNQRVDSLFVGSSHNCVVMTDNTMKCWGNDDSNRLGYSGTAASRGDGVGEMGASLPFVSIPLASEFVYVDGGLGTTCGVTRCGNVHCWGRNGAGQVGIGSTTTQVTPSSALSLGTGRRVPTDLTCSYSSTKTIDGSAADWLASERLATSAGGSTWIGVSWDSTYVYVASNHPDVANGGAQHWFMAHFGNGTTSGHRTGMTHNTQSPRLATFAQTSLRYKADFSYNSSANAVFTPAETWSQQNNYFTVPVQSAAIAESNANQVVEFRIRRSELFLNHFDVLSVQANWLFEGAGFESTYAATPSTMITNGVYDPNFASFWRFDLAGAGAPNTGEIRAALP